jgi:hypothetical protein
MDKIILKKDGLWVSEWDGDKKKHVVSRLLTDNQLFFCAWNRPLEIKGTVRLKDLIAYLQTLEPLMLDIIGRIVGANFDDYLKQDLTPARDPDRKSKLKCIEIFKYYELSNQHDIDNWDFQDCAVSAHGIGAPWEEGCEDVPLEKRGNSYAIEFTAWKYLMNLPLRLKESTQITTATWKRQKPKRMGFKRKGSKKFERGLSWVSDKTVDNYKQQVVKVSYTLGEFFQGLFDELCFFEAPDVRDAREKEIIGRYEKVKERDPEDDDYSELVSEPIEE